MTDPTLPPLRTSLLTPAPDPRLLNAYADGMGREERDSGGPAAGVRPPRLALHSRQPPAATTDDRWRHHVYGTPGRFAQLADVPRFVGDIRSLL